MCKQRHLPQQKHLKDLIFIIPIVLLSLCAFVFNFLLVGYSFLALVCFAMAIITGAYFFFYKKNTKTTRILRNSLTVIISIDLILSIITAIPIISYSQKKEKSPSDFCIVLGAAVHGTIPSRVLRQRIDAAYEFLTVYPDGIAILSGGQGPDEAISEGECMKRELIKMGIDENRLFVENKSTSTKENICFSYEIIQALSPDTKEITIISSETHLFRACLIAQDFGLSASPYHAHTDYPILRLATLLREIPGVWLEWLT